MKSWIREQVQEHLHLLIAVWLILMAIVGLRSSMSASGFWVLGFTAGLNMGIWMQRVWRRVVLQVITSNRELIRINEILIKNIYPKEVPKTQAGPQPGSTPSVN